MCAEKCRLRELDIFKPNTAQELEFMKSIRLRNVKFPAGKTIVNERASSAQLYTLLEGWAIRHKTLKNGRRQILNIMFPGDLIGLQQNLLDESTSSVEAITEVELCELDKNKLWLLYQSFPSLAYDITWICAHEEQIVDDNLLNVGARSAVEKIAMLILHVFKRYRALYPEAGKVIPFPLNQQDVADALGLSLAHTNKSLKKLEKLGLHRIQDGKLTIMNEKALATVADYFESPITPRPLIC
ncbi:CRP-like cAMP-binding protein [Methylovorus glucosotrophus]|jgi:CRP-like cAMP-binding protein|uniref:Crp/Fnr family transcriptional regulator n=1 Tax=Methylovorus glucosotrophus TaxID=266009 RepID=UPI001331A376|nr:Crp/Fnr family transcriptional regulator [Methylovorus glucosotrophus]KAF0843782.1 CRP-like cAMP-binding protein [Methylovorus glucosotrophus]